VFADDRAPTSASVGDHGGAGVLVWKLKNRGASYPVTGFSQNYRRFRRCAVRRSVRIMDATEKQLVGDRQAV